MHSARLDPFTAAHFTSPIAARLFTADDRLRAVLATAEHDWSAPDIEPGRSALALGLAAVRHALAAARPSKASLTAGALGVRATN